MPRPTPVPRQPGSTESSVEAAIAAGQSGGTHKVARHPDPETLPKSKVKGDPERPAEAAVNAKKEMSYKDAMAAKADRDELDRLNRLSNPTEKQSERITELQKTALMRNVLTEHGWVCVNREPPAIART